MMLSANFISCQRASKKIASAKAVVANSVGTTAVEELCDNLFEELQKEGKSCTECAALSGFSDYSSFYRAYVNKYGKSPQA